LPTSSPLSFFVILCRLDDICSLNI
jgi:hypothetical protein